VPFYLVRYRGRVVVLRGVVITDGLSYYWSPSILLEPFPPGLHAIEKKFRNSKKSANAIRNSQSAIAYSPASHLTKCLSF